MFLFTFDVKLSSGIFQVKALRIEDAIVLAQAKAIGQGKTYQYIGIN